MKNRWLITFILLWQTALSGELNMAVSEPASQEAYFAGGCFWCVESDFEKHAGILEAISGYMGGKEENPTYEQVSAKQTGHYEAVKVLYDPSKTTYEDLLNIFWRSVNPTDAGGQFADRGPQYLTAIFYVDEKQKTLAEKSKQELDQSGKYDQPIVTPILKATPFYTAEEYHQDYYKKHPNKYKLYRFYSGRDSYLKKTWK